MDDVQLVDVLVDELMDAAVDGLVEYCDDDMERAKALWPLVRDRLTLLLKSELGPDA
jgi:hypothetical protein